MDRFRTLLQERTAERGGLARLAKSSGISSPVIGRWRDGIGRPSDTNLKKLAPALGVPYEELMKLCGYLPGDGSPDDLDPRLAAFLATIERAFHALSGQEWQIREDAGRALFRIDDRRRVTDSDQERERHKGDRIQPVRSVRRPYVSQSVASQIDRYGLLPADA